MAKTGIPAKNGLNFIWLIKLRWGSLIGQLATILGVYLFLELQIPLVPLLVIVAAQAVSNLVVGVWLRRHKEEIREWQLAAVMSLDIVFLTMLLFLTGGPENPFRILYLVNIALAAVALHAQWTWMLVGLALFGMGLLPVVEYRELPLEHLSAASRLGVYQQGRWVAFGVTAGFIVHFLWRITSALAQREKELTAARDTTARQEQLTSLATVAAGAAHELATPLGTIALVAKELERSIANPKNSADSQVFLEDVQLIRNQVARCRLILDQMGAGLGRSSEQAVEDIGVPALLREALIGVRTQPAVVVEVDATARESTLQLPARAVAQALRAVITNAQDASGGDCIVRVGAVIAGNRLVMNVVDTGGGMGADVLTRALEPFYTTKPPGSGMGLGLYLCRAVIEGLGGRLQMTSIPGEGTSVRIELPIQVDLAHIQEYSVEHASQ